jgi:hypothetical protein
MSSGKIRLDLASLRVKSFQTTPNGKPRRGTVVGMQQGCTQVTWCTMDTCGNTGCNGASVTDSPSPMTVYCDTYYNNWTCDAAESCVGAGC